MYNLEQCRGNLEIGEDRDVQKCVRFDVRRSDVAEVMLLW